VSESLPEAPGLIAGAARSVVIGLINVYQCAVSPLLPPSCRYIPCCSEYGALAVGKYGAIRGLGMAVMRILRCHPFARGGFDPVR
jgi:putative membrane protein insertion efficiency factor